MRRPLVVAVAAVAAAAVTAAGGGGIWLALSDGAAPEARLGAIDRDRATGDAAGDEPAPSSPEGRWAVVADDSVFVGYRVTERFVGGLTDRVATGRTAAVVGGVTVAGDRITAASFTADLTQLDSSQERRDSALRHRGIETGRYPEASFELTVPIRLSDAPARGETVEVTAVGGLTLHGRTAPVRVALEARWDGATISIAGEAPITLADFGIDAIDVHGLVRTDDRATLELQLLLVPA